MLTPIPVFMILMILGQVVGVSAPLPYSLAECQARADTANALIDERFTVEAYQKLFRSAYNAFSAGDVRFSCVLTEQKPGLGEQKV